MGRNEATFWATLALVSWMIYSGLNDDNPDQWMDRYYNDLVDYYNERRDPDNPPIRYRNDEIPLITTYGDHPLNILLRHAEHKRSDVESDRAYDIAFGGVDISHIRTFGEYYEWAAHRLKEIEAENYDKYKANIRSLERNGDEENDLGEKIAKGYPKGSKTISHYNRLVTNYNTHVRSWNEDHPDEEKKALRRYMPYSTAYSAYQWMVGTAKTIQERHRLPDDYELTNENIDALQYGHLVYKIGLNEFLNDHISIGDFATRLAKEWAGIPLKEGVKKYNGKPAKHGESYYSGMNGNSASSDVTYEDVVRTLELTLEIHRANTFQPEFSSEGGTSYGFQSNNNEQGISLTHNFSNRSYRDRPINKFPYKHLRHTNQLYTNSLKLG